MVISIVLLVLTPTHTHLFLTGEASASKTQICLQLLLACQLPRSLGGLSDTATATAAPTAAAIYMYTEGDPPLTRLKELANLVSYRIASSSTYTRPANQETATAPTAPTSDSPIPSPSSFLDNIYIKTGFTDGQSLLRCLESLEPLLLQRSNTFLPTGTSAPAVKLLVIDSIAYLFRDLLVVKNATTCTSMTRETNIEAFADRTALLFKISSLLRRYADTYNLAVVVTNQVTDVVAGGTGMHNHSSSTTTTSIESSSGGHTAGMVLTSSGRHVLPSLGLAWANCVNTRIFISKQVRGTDDSPLYYEGGMGDAMHLAVRDGSIASVPPIPPQLRAMQIVFSPHLPQRRCYYVVEPTGARGLHPMEVSL